MREQKWNRNGINRKEIQKYQTHYEKMKKKIVIVVSEGEDFNEYSNCKLEVN